jgi:hypothetical protein
MADLRAMGEPMPWPQRLRRPTRRQVLLRAAQIYARLTATPGPHPRHVRDDLPDRLGPARQPAETLAPRIGATRLADALNTLERPLGKGPQDG